MTIFADSCIVQQVGSWLRMFEALHFCESCVFLYLCTASDLCLVISVITYFSIPLGIGESQQWISMSGLWNIHLSQLLLWHLSQSFSICSHQLDYPGTTPHQIQQISLVTGTMLDIFSWLEVCCNTCRRLIQDNECDQFHSGKLLLVLHVSFYASVHLCLFSYLGLLCRKCALFLHQETHISTDFWIPWSKDFCVHFQLLKYSVIKS